jgi:hypothetical protein
VEPWRSPFGLGSGAHTLQTVSDALQSSGVPGPALWTWDTVDVIAGCMASPPRQAVNDPIVVVVVISGATNVAVVAVHSHRNGTHRHNRPWALSRSLKTVVAIGTAAQPVAIVPNADGGIMLNNKPVRPGCVAVL